MQKVLFATVNLLSYYLYTWVSTCLIVHLPILDCNCTKNMLSRQNNSLFFYIVLFYGCSISNKESLMGLKLFFFLFFSFFLNTANECTSFLLKPNRKRKIFEFACHSCRLWIITLGKSGNTTHIIQQEAWFILCVKQSLWSYKAEMSFLCSLHRRKNENIIFTSSKQGSTF